MRLEYPVVAKQLFLLSGALVLTFGRGLALAESPPPGDRNSFLSRDDADPARVDAIHAGIERGERYLLGRLPEIRQDRADLTALDLSALNWNDLRENPQVKSARERLSAVDVQSAKLVAVRLRLCEYPSPGQPPQNWERDRLQRAKPDAVVLMAMEMRDGLDLTESGDAARAMAVAARAGVDVPDTYWKHVDAAWRKAQRPDGGWSLGEAKSPAVRVRLTAKGISTLLLVREALFNSDVGAGCKPMLPDASLNAGFDWLDHHAADALTDLQTLSELADVGVISGRRQFGSMNWYAQGSMRLLSQQNEDGSWPAVPELSGVDPAAKSIPETAYALHFLRSGQMPVGMMKLDLLTGAGGVPQGETRPADVARFTDWAGPVGLCSAEVAWERVNARMAVRDLSDSALLYISSSKPLSFNNQEARTLREFVLHGGMILGNADCGSASFVESFTAVGKQLFPDLPFRELPPDHVIFSEVYKRSKWQSPSKVMAAGNGVREFMLIASDMDFGQAWQVGKRRSGREAFELGVNILVYANGKDFLGGVRGRPTCPSRNESIKADRTIRVARLLYDGNADPEPGGWERLSIVMHNGAHADLDVTAVQLGSGRLKNAEFQVAHLTGTETLSLTDADRAEIGAFVKGGGTLIIDAAGGSRAFSESSARELAGIFPSSATPRPDAAAGEFGVLLDKDADVYNTKAAPLHEFHYRRFCITQGVHGKVPRIQVVDIGGRHAVFFSPLDLSTGLVGQGTDGIIGYAPETATAIMRNLLLYAAGER